MKIYRICPQCGNRDCIISSNRNETIVRDPYKLFCEKKCKGCSINPSLCPKRLLVLSRPHYLCLLCGCTFWPETIPDEYPLPEHVIDRITLIKGYGVWFTSTESDGDVFTTIIDRLDEEDIHIIEAEGMEHPMINPEESYLTRWNPDKVKVEIIFGEDCNLSKIQKTKKDRERSLLGK